MTKPRKVAKRKNTKKKKVTELVKPSQPPTAWKLEFWVNQLKKVPGLLKRIPPLVDMVGVGVASLGVIAMSAGVAACLALASKEFFTSPEIPVLAKVVGAGAAAIIGGKATSYLAKKL